MTEAAFALALAAGMLAAVNPCGFALLPAYLSFLVLGDQTAGGTRAVARALWLTASMTVGFVAVFGTFGLVVAPVAGQVQRHLPWFTVFFGLALAAIGAWLLAGRQIPVPQLNRGSKITGSFGSMALFGVAYAIASLGCTIGPFLALVVTSFRSGSLVDGVLLFALYAAGMALVVGVAAVAVALARSSLVGRLRQIGRVVPRIGGALLVLAGSYVAYYGWYEVRTFSGAPASDDPIIGAAAQVQRGLAWLVSSAGAPVLSAILAALVIGAVGLTARRRRRRTTEAERR